MIVPSTFDANSKRPSTFSTAHLDRLCPMPNPILTHEGRSRFYHLDLAAFDEFELSSEKRRAQQRADFDCDPNRRAWLLERVAHVAAEYRRREQPPQRRPEQPDIFKKIPNSQTPRESPAGNLLEDVAYSPFEYRNGKVAGR